MNKILVSGLGLGKEIGVCDCCNMNYQLLMNNTETLLMADKICVPQNRYYGKEDKEIKAVELMLDILDSEKMIETFDPSEMYTDSFKNTALDKTLSDISTIQNECQEINVIKNYKNETKEAVSENTFCTPMVASINTSLIIAQDLNAQCLLNEYEEKYLQYRYRGICSRLSIQQISEVYKNVFSILIPNNSIMPDYLKNYNCDSCEKDIDCKDKYLSQFEKDLKNILKYREYDEIHQIKKIINRIIAKKNSLLEPMESQDIIREFENEKKEIQKNIRLRFPLIKRFANFITMVSKPLAIGNAFLNSNNPILFGTPLVIDGAGTIIKSGLQYYENKNNWVNFIEKQEIVPKGTEI